MIYFDIKCIKKRISFSDYILQVFMPKFREFSNFTDTFVNQMLNLYICVKI